jgi:hypothetical protein
MSVDIQSCAFLPHVIPGIATYGGCQYFKFRFLKTDFWTTKQRSVKYLTTLSAD